MYIFSNENSTYFKHILAYWRKVSGVAIYQDNQRMLHSSVHSQLLATSLLLNLYREQDFPLQGVKYTVNCYESKESFTLKLKDRRDR